MSIDKKDLLSLAQKKNFNMKFFKQYLNYQFENRNEYPNVFSLEEYAVVMSIVDAGFDLFSEDGQLWYSNWIGFKNKYFTPDYLSFFRFCAARDIYPYNNVVRRKLKKEEIY